MGLQQKRPLKCNSINKCHVLLPFNWQMLLHTWKTAVCQIIQSEFVGIQTQSQALTVTT